MAQTISATDAELVKPVNVLFQASFLRQAMPLAPYFVGTKSGELTKNRGTATVKWRRINAITPSTTALSELTTTASYMQGRDSVALSTTDVTATVAKYGQFLILNEEVDVFNFSEESNEIFKALGIAAGRSANQLQRNIVEDNATLLYVSGTSDGDVDSKITLNSIKSVVNTLTKNSATPFTAISTGSQSIGTTPVLPAYWGLCHPDVAQDIIALSGFKSVETYAGQVAVAPGEFGMIQSAGYGVRFIQSPDAGVDAESGAAISSTGLIGITNIDLYTTVIYGMEALGSVGLGKAHTDGIFMAGDKLEAIELIVKEKGAGGTSDPYNEISTAAYKFWHAGAVLNTAWVRGIRSGATDISA